MWLHKRSFRIQHKTKDRERIVRRLNQVWCISPCHTRELTLQLQGIARCTSLKKIDGVNLKNTRLEAPVQSLKEQSIRSKYQRHNTTEHRQSNFINNAAIGAIPAGSRVDGGVARQQQLGDFNATIQGGVV